MTLRRERWIEVGSLERLAEQAILAIRVEGVDLILVRDADNIVACERACPHEQADLCQGRVAEGKLFCPRHFAWFDLSDGRISPGWPSRDLRCYPVRIENARIWIDAAALDTEA